jgi:tRNA(Ile)-lysidine synthase
LEGQTLLDELAIQDLNKVKKSETSLLLSELVQLSKARFNNLIRYFLSGNDCLMPSTEQLKQLRYQLMAEEDKNPAIKVGKGYFRRYKDTVYLTPNYADISQWQQEVDLSSTDITIELPDKAGLITFSSDNTVKRLQQRIAPPKAGQRVSLRFTHDNPTCLPDYRQHSRSLKKILQELNIPTWQRKRLPFLYYDDVLVAVIGHFVCQSHLPVSNEISIYLKI